MKPGPDWRDPAVMDRRHFIRMGTGGLLAVPLLGGLGCRRTGSVLPSADAGLPADGGVCVATGKDIEGPYYRAGAPFRMDIAGAGEAGERLFVRGTVFASDCRTPLADAVVDVWQANAAGQYDNDGSRGTLGANDFYLRGQIRTDASGRYELATVVPGRYPNAGTYRPSHVHYKVRAPGLPELTTQLYFAGDEFIPGDPWASVSRSIISLRRDSAGAHGVFDLVVG